MKKQALQVAKEITVKFIEIGRISPSNFPEFFSSIYNEILNTINDGAPSGSLADFDDEPDSDSTD